MQLLHSTVGRKILMAVTGLILISFVIIHLLGNTSVFVGPDGLNAYAVKLHSLGPVVWIFRLVMLAVFALHILIGIQLTLENRAANPVPYAQKKTLRTTFAAETMIISGLVLAAFVVYHILHFTVHVTNPEISVGMLPPDAMGRPDVFTMVVKSFQKGYIALVYVLAMVLLYLHLSHGGQSFLQTFGLANDKTLPNISLGSKAVSLLILLGYISIPVLIVIGLVK